MKKILLLCLLLLPSMPGFAQRFDSLHIFFPLDKNSLTEQSVKFIDSLIHTNILAPGRKIVVLGYGDYLGSDAYNADLSYARAKNVQDYLILSGFNKQDITLCIGKGKNEPTSKSRERFPTSFRDRGAIRPLPRK